MEKLNYYTQRAIVQLISKKLSFYLYLEENLEKKKSDQQNQTKNGTESGKSSNEKPEGEDDSNLLMAVQMKEKIQEVDY